jgi:hypothetical protein
MDTVIRALDRIDDTVQALDHMATCPYRQPGAECDCGKGAALAAITRLFTALDQLGLVPHA